MSKIEQITKLFENAPIYENSFSTMLTSLREDNVLEKICNHFNMPESDVVNTLHEELFIPGMTNGIAWQALCWIETDIESNKEVNSLKGTIRNCILMAGIFYANVSEEKTYQA